MLSKVSALWLVVLILLPFTAPFPTCDIADFFGRSAAEQEVPLAPPTSSTALLADAMTSLLVLPLARIARQLRQVAVSDLNTPYFAARSALVILGPPVRSDDVIGSSLRTRLERRRLARRVEWALALGRRGEVRADGLSLVSFRNQLVIEWHAREVHPWDRDLPVGQAAERFVQQSFEDVDAAIGRLFSALPDVDEIELKVTDKVTDQPIMRGSITRQDAGNTCAASVRMKLKSMGVSYRLSGPNFEVLPEL